MSEAGLWSTMRVRMGEGKHWREATRHEDALQAGISDVSYISANGHHGWIELKKLAEWPKRPSTIVRLDHYTDAQRIFLKRKGRRGGFTWLFLKVDRDHLLFDWIGAQRVGQVNQEDLVGAARRVWRDKMNWKELGEALCER